MKSRFRRHTPYYITLLATIFFIAIYFYLRRFNPSEASEIVITILAIVAGVVFWLEYHHNSKVNEAQFVMELNDQFITDANMSAVEHELEKFYAKVKAGNDTEDDRRHLRTLYDINSEKRQHLVNYLVHLEGVAALVNNGVLRLSTITDLMAYRYFIAVNNPVVQELELIPYKDFYKGIIKVFKDWKVDKMPMEKYRLDKVLKTKV